MKKEKLEPASLKFFSPPQLWPITKDEDMNTTIETQSKCMKLTRRAGKLVEVSHDLLVSF